MTEKTSSRNTSFTVLLDKINKGDTNLQLFKFIRKNLSLFPFIHVLLIFEFDEGLFMVTDGVRERNTRPTVYDHLYMFFPISGKIPIGPTCIID